MEEADAKNQLQSERDQLSKLPINDQVSMLFQETSSLRKTLDLILGRLDALAPPGRSVLVASPPTTPRDSRKDQWPTGGTPESSYPNEQQTAPKDRERPHKENDVEPGLDTGAGFVGQFPGQVVLSNEQFLQLTDRLDRRGSKRDLEGLPPRRMAPKDRSDDDESNSDSDSVPTDRRERRTSMLYPSTFSKNAPATQVLMYRSQPDFEHITLKYLSVSAVFRFWDAYDLYLVKYGIEINAAAQIQEDVRNTIMAKSGIKDIEVFLTLRSDKLRRLIQAAIRPTDRGMFIDRLDKSLYFWKKDEQPFDVSLDTWQRFYDKLLVFRKEFEAKYEFLAHENSRNEPKLDNKEGGTIKTFLSKLPKEYAENAFRNLTTSKFASLYEFLDAFYVQAENHYKRSIKAKELLSFVKPVSRKTSDDKREAPKSKMGQRVHAVEDDHDLNELSMECPSESPGDSKETEETLIGTEEVSNGPVSQLNAFGGLNRGIPQRLPPKPPIAPKAADKPTAGAPKGPNGCFRALTEGKCTKPNCTFDHSMAVLQSTKDDLVAKLGKDLWKARALHAIYSPDQSASSQEENG